MWLIQPVAALRMFGYNPQGILSGRVPRLVMEVVEGRLTNQLPKSKDAQDFNHWFHRTGVTQAITRGNLVRGTLLDAAVVAPLLVRLKMLQSEICVSMGMTLLKHST